MEGIITSEIPRRIDLNHGTVEFSREATVFVPRTGGYRYAFTENTLIARVTHRSGFASIVVFPRGYLSQPFNRDAALATACFAAGTGGNGSVVEVPAYNA